MAATIYANGYNVDGYNGAARVDGSGNIYRREVCIGLVDHSGNVYVGRRCVCAIQTYRNGYGIYRGQNVLAMSSVDGRVYRYDDCIAKIDGNIVQGLAALYLIMFDN